MQQRCVLVVVVVVVAVLLLVVVVGCAGGGDLVASYDYTEEAVGAGQVARDIALTGLKGGHSGIDIILGLGNANKLMARFLRTAICDFDARIVKINAGTARNAIPRESKTTPTSRPFCLSACERSASGESCTKARVARKPTDNCMPIFILADMPLCDRRRNFIQSSTLPIPPKATTTSKTGQR